MNTPNREDGLTLEILNAIEESSDVTQRGLAQRSGVALGLANSYLKRCVRKGLVKIQQAPANRYLYYLTPQGFAEKSRLTAQYLSYSFGFYRKATNSCVSVLAACAAQGCSSVALYGVSELAEIIDLHVEEYNLTVSGIADGKLGGERFLGRRVVSDITLINADVWILTDLTDPGRSLAELEAKTDAAVAPCILGLRT
jgi:predicted transcriptional regulator